MYNPALMHPPINITFEQAEKHQFFNEFPRAEDYNNVESITKAFPHLAKINDFDFDIDNIKECRTFILRSNNEDDVHKVISFYIFIHSNIFL